MTIDVRALRVEEIAAASVVMDGVMQRAYNVASFAAQIGWYATVQPDCLVVATNGDTIVGTGCGIAFPDAGFGWIGVIATEPAYERQGIGKRITEHVATILDGLGCASALDASLAGEPLYTRMGFVDHGPTRVMAVDPSVVVAAVAAAAVVSTPGGPSVTVLSTASARDLAEVVAYDASVFGADRSALLQVLLRDYPGRAAFVRSADGAVAGLVVAQHAVIGPLVAEDANMLGALLAFAAGLPWDNGARICVPPESVHLRTLVELGCHTVRELRHMRRGIEVLPGRSDRYAGRISLGIG